MQTKKREHTKNKRGKPQKREDTTTGGANLGVVEVQSRAHVKILCAHTLREREREHTQRTRGANQKERVHKEQEGKRAPKEQEVQTKKREHIKNKRGKPKRKSTQRTRGANKKKEHTQKQEGQTSEWSKCRAEPM